MGVIRTEPSRDALAGVRANGYKSAILQRYVNYPSPRTTHTSRRGLTIIETMLALIMLSLMIVGVLGLMGTLLVGTTKSTDTTAGTFVGQFLLDDARNTGPPTLNGGVVEGVRPMQTHEEGFPVNFNYRMEWTLVAEPRQFLNAQNRLEDTEFGTRLYQVKVTVWWMIEDPTDGRGEGGGKRSVILERLIEFANE